MNSFLVGTQQGHAPNTKRTLLSNSPHETDSVWACRPRGGSRPGDCLGMRHERPGFDRSRRAAPYAGVTYREPIQKKEPGPGTSRSVTPSVERVRIVDTAFQPEDLTVAVRSTIVWKQIGLQAHSVTATDESFDSSPSCSPIRTDKCLGEGDDFRVEFKEPGSYDYFCSVHGLPDGTGMTGTITVKD
jgi:plastocyanin